MKHKATLRLRGFSSRITLADVNPNPAEQAIRQHKNTFSKNTLASKPPLWCVQK